MANLGRICCAISGTQASVCFRPSIPAAPAFVAARSIGQNGLQAALRRRSGSCAFQTSAPVALGPKPTLARITVAAAQLPIPDLHSTAQQGPGSQGQLSGTNRPVAACAPMTAFSNSSKAYWSLDSRYPMIIYRSAKNGIWRNARGCYAVALSEASREICG